MPTLRSIALIALFATAPARAEQVQWLSRPGAPGDGVVQPNGASFASGGQSTSADGTKIVFSSQASNLVAGDTNGVADLFYKDLETGETRLVSRRLDGTQTTAGLGCGQMSADGRVVVYATSGRNVGLTSNFVEFVAWFRDTNETVWISAPGASLFPEYVSCPQVSADGRLAVFASSNGLVAEDTDGSPDVYAYDLGTRTLKLVAPGITSSLFPSISADGRYVAFTGNGAHIYDRSLELDYPVPGNGTRPLLIGAGPQVVYFEFGEPGGIGCEDANQHLFTWNPLDFYFECLTRSIAWVAGQQAVAVFGTPITEVPNGFSRDGALLAFQGRSAACSTWDCYHVYATDIATGANRVVSVRADGALATGGSRPSVDDLGWVMFDTLDALVPEDTNGRRDVYRVKSGLANVLLRDGFE